MTREGFLGTNFRFIYSDETYRINILSDTSLHWTREVGDNVGQSDEESYVLDVLSEDLIMLSWVEADGLGLSNVMNLSDGNLVTHANHGRDVFQNRGQHTLKGA